MDHEDRQTISFTLGCEPLPLDAIHLSPMRRKRLFWSNIPLPSEVLRPEPDAQLRLQDVLEVGRRARVVKIRCITTKTNSFYQGFSKSPQHPVDDADGKPDVLTMKEVERCFGFPDDYPKVASTSIDVRRHLLGMSWSIPCVKFLFSALKDYFSESNKEKK